MILALPVSVYQKMTLNIYMQTSVTKKNACSLLFAVCVTHKHNDYDYDSDGSALTRPNEVCLCFRFRFNRTVLCPIVG
jgi:hypothetical protein